MLHLRRHLGNAIGVLALLALIVPATVMAQGLPVRAHMIQSAASPVGGAVTQQELPGCSNPSEPFAGASQGCGENPFYEGGRLPVRPLVRRRNSRAAPDDVPRRDLRPRAAEGRSRPTPNDIA